VHRGRNGDAGVSLSDESSNRRRRISMKKFLAGRLGREQGETTALQQKERLAQLLDRVKGKSRSQLKTLKRSILPYVALYQVLLENRMDRRILDDYIIHRANEAGRLYRRMERLPFSFSLFRMATARKMRSDSWTATFERNDRRMIEFTITGCLWYDTCEELGCPELCEKFCDGDDLTFGSMKTIRFKRSKTLGNNRKTGP
jgi:hypothetical protein